MATIRPDAQTLGGGPAAPALRSRAGVSPALKVGGITPFTATDFPGRLSAVIFVQGCPWRCGYCHNPHLQPRTAESPLAWEDIRAFLARRVGLIDAVVFSGGEPTMDPGLEAAVREVRESGFQIGLHSGGTHPKRLRQVLPLVDWVGLDIKATSAGYEAVTRVRGSGVPAFESLRAVLESGVDHEIRTLARQLARMGVTRYALQVFRATGCQDADLNGMRFTAYPGAELVAELEALFPSFTLRNEGGA